jgi:hypothetical protein
LITKRNGSLPPGGSVELALNEPSSPWLNEVLLSECSVTGPLGEVAAVVAVVPRVVAVVVLRVVGVFVLAVVGVVIVVPTLKLVGGAVLLVVVTRLVVLVVEDATVASGFFLSSPLVAKNTNAPKRIAAAAAIAAFTRLCRVSFIPDKR